MQEIRIIIFFFIRVRKIISQSFQINEKKRINNNYKKKI